MGRRLTIIACSLAAALGSTALAAGSGMPAACGPAAPATIGAVDATVVAHIYANELAGPEVHADLGHVMAASDLSAAVAAGNRRAVLAATTRIVYTPHWHIVRLRVTDLRGHVLADVGGPYVTVPIGGRVMSGGRLVGNFLMSVQDDQGVVKLEWHFVGNPAAIYVGSRPVVSYGSVAFPAGVPAGPTARLRGLTYHVETQRMTAFPSGTITFVQLVATPAASIAAHPCTVVRANEYGRVAAQLARLAPSLPSHWVGYAGAVHTYTGALVFVRSGGRQLASSGGTGPPSIPNSGTVSYQGRSWLVYSFQPSPPARVYLLVTPS